MRELIKEKLRLINIEATEDQTNALYEYYKLLIEWNQNINLTAITDYEDVVMKHFVDSLSISHYIRLEDYETVIDIGTGAGFPGMVLAVMYPHLKVTLLDSLQKRVRFLNAVRDKLNLSNVTTLHGRAEDFAKNPEYREQYDLCVSRAVANLSTLSEYCIPYIRVGGIFVPYKSGDINTEVREAGQAISTLGAQISSVEKYELADTDISRSFIKIVKERSTDMKYPRKAPIPAKKPL